MGSVRRLIRMALVLSIAVGFETVVVAADPSPLRTELSELKFVPENALAVVIINHLNVVDEQITQLAGEMQIPVPSLLPLLKKVSGIQEAVDDHSSVVLVLMPGAAEDSAPIPVLFIPVTDYKNFVGQFKPADSSAEIIDANIGYHAVVIAHKGDFAVITAESDHDTLKKVLGNSSSVVPLIGALGDWAGGQTISLVATPTGVKRGISAARKAVAQMKEVLANSKDSSMQMAAGNMVVYERFLEVADKEISVFAVGLHVDNDGGLHLDSRAVFVADGSWAMAASDSEAIPRAELKCLPGGPFMLAFAGAMPASLSKGFLQMSVDMINNMGKAAGGTKLTEEQSNQLNGLMEKSMAGLRSMSMVMGPPEPGGSMYSNMVAIMKVKDAHRYITNYQEAMEKVRDILKTTGVELPFIQEIKKVEIDGIDGIELTMNMSPMVKEMTTVPESKHMMDLMVGPDGKLIIYIVPIDESTVAISYTKSDNIARIKAACQNPQSSLAADTDIGQTAKLLPPGAQWIGYLSLKGFLDFTSAYMSAAHPTSGAPALPTFPQSAPIGVAAVQSSDGLDLQIVLPGAALKGIGTYVKQIPNPKAASPTH